MKTGRLLLTALATFVVFGPIMFVWHTVLFKGFYLGPGLSVKSADSFSPPFLMAAVVVLSLGMAYFIPPRLTKSHRLWSGAALGAITASLAVDYHNLFLMGLFPGQDPWSLYLMDALWAIVDGALAGVVLTAVHDRLDVGARA